MTHKVHPKIYRIRDILNWNSRWLNKKTFPQYLEEDFKIREFLRKKLRDAGVSNIEIERSSGKINVIINTARSGLIIGRSGAGVEELKKEIEREILKGKPASALRAQARKQELKIEIQEIKNPWLSATLVSQWMAGQIEKRVRYRRVLKQALDKVMVNKEVKGVRVEVSGRLDGVEIARRQWLKKGQLPRQTIRADIDYAENRAYCTYGVVGIKVWIYKGEKFER
ncbi:MAG: 30S ribosomal protein S3 [Candidatus Nealsonbacteria bacterium CG10_big_fil_rev_8_21_14_0_10_36_23]|uniref:Small ribosomal subunit protein uS3 n=1 Tax=Candidatus Nealsonbacteria bacterium CG10_big_fil_rev_8_21_14_0_10_36_23 TaxID=1974709 RepID=A0A2H0TMT1_9BACT|nr:MAG: 30S ribosomal protein S3 [Candidatus Nealsonbacteria bacterium CG10_big_fil_rev_8_21_14_0_10_36_23]